MTTRKTEERIELPAPKDEMNVRKLKLHKTTLLDLSDRELDGVRGGGPDTRTCSVRIRGCP